MGSFVKNLLAVPLALVDLFMSAEVGHNRKAAPTAVMFAGKRCAMSVRGLRYEQRWKLTFLASMAVRMRLQGTGSCETLVANLAFVLLLRA
jgi:hypothetical protein